jgi:integrase
VIEKHGGQLPKIMNEQKVNVLVKQLIEVAGIDRTIQTPSTSIDKQVGQTSQLSEMVSFHTARRSFATNVYNMGVMSEGELRALTGHTSEAALMTYLNVTQSDVSKRATAKLLAAFR